MTTFRVIITGDRYPTEYTVEATGWHTAISRAIKEWKGRFKGSRTGELRIRAIKGGKLLTSHEE